ncbi:hypothetical protein BaRGS_00018342 [Batillaria attramentaria]|uniref:Uncharacterized protein n=1 Tax=Batillaria attramentaria TaxID=370345 RepID=A0ABD0KTP1_9CAEN
MANVVKKIISTEAGPKAIGPYSQAVVAGNTLYISGMVGFIPSTMEIVKGGVAAETDQTLKNIGAILKEAGATYNNVVKTTILLTDIEDYAVVNEVYAKYFSENKPARAAYQVANLPGKLARVEIETVAILGNVTCE